MPKDNTQWKSFQDNEPVIAHNPKKQMLTVLKNKNITKSKKLDGDDIVVPPKYTKEFSSEVMKKRIERKMNRKQLANLLGVKENEITGVETRKGVYNGKLVSRLQKVLGIPGSVIPRNDK